MTLKEKIDYFNYYYESDDFLKEIDYQDFFNLEMFDYLNTISFLQFDDSIWIKLFKTFSKNQQIMDQIVKLLCKHGIYINLDDLNSIMSDDVLANSFIISLGNLLNNDGVVKSSIKSMVLRSNILLSRIINNYSFDASKI